MADEKPPFEIIEDMPYEPKGKRKSYRRPLFGHIPWRWVGSAFIAGVILVGASVLLFLNHAEPVYVSVTATPALVSSPTETPIPTRPILDVAQSGNWVAVADNAMLRLYRDGVLVHLLDGYQNPVAERHVALAFSPNGNFLAALVTEMFSDSGPAVRLRLYNLQTGKIWRDVLAHEGSFVGQFSGVALAYSPDGKLMAASGGDGWTALMEPSGDVITTLDTRALGTFALAFSADSKRLTIITRLENDISADQDNAQVQVWDVSNPAAPVQGINNGAVLDWPDAPLAALSEDGHYAAYLTQDDTIELNDLEGNFIIGHLAFPDTSRIESLTINPKGNIIAFVQRDVIESANEPFEQVMLRAVYWWREGGLRYGNLYQPRVLNTVGASLLRFRSKAGGLFYVESDTNKLIDWEFGTGDTRTIDNGGLPQ